MDDWMNAAELAALKLPGLPTSKRQINEVAKAKNWERRPRQGKQGGGFEYPLTALPLAARVELVERDMAAQHQKLPVPAMTRAVAVGAPDNRALTSLTDVQRRVADARLVILREVERHARVVSAEAAINKLIDLVERGELPAEMQALVAVANARRGEDRTLAVRTVKRWKALFKAGGLVALAPKEVRAPAPIPWWADGFLRHFRRPQKPSMAEALAAFSQEIAPTGQIPPSYPQVRRFLDRLGTIEINRGRMGPRDIKNLKAYVKRDDALLDPLDIALVDGHTFDAEVCHPFHGGPFRPEITTVVDAKTRLALGFSLGLAESAQSVMDAVRDAVQRYGVMAWLYSDNGPGNKADLTSGPVVGLIARLGASHMLSRAYNSMSRGRSERVHQTIWVRAARKLPSFIGADMDAEASNRVHKLTRKELQGRGRNLLMPWRDFVAFCQAETDDYNNRPHSGLPSIIDTDTGKRRHQTPMEAWRAAIEAGFTPDAVAPDLAADLFRPHRIARTNRGLIQFSNLEYFHQDLVEHGGDDVMVGYEWNDPSFVWVKTLEGRLICKAALDGHKRDFIPKSMLEQGRETRAQGRLRRLEANVAEVQAELRGAPIEAEPLQLTASDEVAADLMLARFEPAPIAEIVPIGAPALRWPGGEAERIGWLARNPDGVAPEDLAWLADRCRVSQGFGLLYEDELAQIRAAQKVSAAG